MRAYAELITKWAQDETMELEYLSDRDKWEPAPNPFSDLTALYREKSKEEKKVEMWQWALSHRATPGKIIASHFYKNSDFLRAHYPPASWQIICRIEGSKIEVDE